MSRPGRKPDRGARHVSITGDTREAILSAMVNKALQGNTAAAKIVLDETRDSGSALEKLDTLLAEFRAAVAQMPSTDTTTDTTAQ